MKRILTAITAILLAFVMLTGCTAAKPNRGIINGVVYVSSDVGLAFIAPDGWRYLTEKEVSEMPETGADFVAAVNGMQPSDEVTEKQPIYDMVAINAATGTSVAVAYYDLATIPGGTDFSGEDFLAFISKSFKVVLPQNIKLVFSDYTDAEIGPNTFKAMSVTFTFPDFSVTQYYHVRRAGGYMLIVMATVFGNDDLGSIMANFTWVDGQIE